MALGREGTLLQSLPCLVPCSHCRTWKRDHWPDRRNWISSCFARVGMTASDEEARNQVLLALPFRPLVQTAFSSFEFQRHNVLAKNSPISLMAL